MLTGELTIRHAQHVQPWTVPYAPGILEAIDTGSVPYAMSNHAVLHAAKSVGKLAAVFEAADHGAPIGSPERDTIKAMSADLLTIALRLANLHGFDLAAALVERVEEKNGVDILKQPFEI